MAVCKRGNDLTKFLLHSKVKDFSMTEVAFSLSKIQWLSSPRKGVFKIARLSKDFHDLQEHWNQIATHLTCSCCRCCSSCCCILAELASCPCCPAAAPLTGGISCSNCIGIRFCSACCACVVFGSTKLAWLVATVLLPVVLVTAPLVALGFAVNTEWYRLNQILLQTRYIYRP